MSRIALISEHASPAATLGSVDAGGQNVYVGALSRHLAERGFEVDVFTRRDSPDLPVVSIWAPGVRIVNLPAGPNSWLPKDDLWPLMPEFLREMLAFVGGGSYSLLHGNFWMSGWVAARAGRRLHIPVVQIFHATGITKRRHQNGDDTSPQCRINVERRIVREVDRLVAQCPEERRELIEEYGARPEKIRVIPAGVDTDVFRPVDRRLARSVLGLPAEAPIVVYVGRLLPRKDVRNVVRALALLKRTVVAPVMLLIVGGETAEPNGAATPEIGAIRHLAAELDVADRIILTGKRPQADLATYYSAGDVAVTTPWYEPFGLTPLEAMACGIPVIGSAVGGIQYTVEDGITGLLVPPRDPHALAVRLRQLLTRRAVRLRMGEAGLQRVREGFTWSVTATRVASLYQELLAPEGMESLPHVARGGRRR
jgi:glycosyltransferase involved in cell wall biosynthesis